MNPFLVRENTVAELRRAQRDPAPRLDISASYGPADYALDFDPQAALRAIGERCWMVIGGLATRAARRKENNGALLVMWESQDPHAEASVAPQFTDPVIDAVQREFALKHTTDEKTSIAIKCLAYDFAGWVHELEKKDRERLGLVVDRSPGTIEVDRTGIREAVRRMQDDLKPLDETRRR